MICILVSLLYVLDYGHITITILEGDMKTGTITAVIAILLAVSSTHAISQTSYQAHLSGSNEVHLPPTTASGTIEAILDGNSLEVSGSFSDLISPVDTSIAGGAHIHVGYVGADGGVVFVLDANLDADMRGGTFDAGGNTFELEPDEIATLEERRYYVNIHTEMFPAGEIRGQLVPAADQVFRVNLTGNNETPPILTSGHGALILELNDNEIILSGSFSDLSSEYTASHIHLGFAGQAGGVEIGLNANLDDNGTGGIYEADNNTYTLTEAQIDLLHNRQLYVNVHSGNFPPGEIRGQILPQTAATFQANLSGATETPPVNTGAFGAVVIEMNDDEITITGSFSGLSSEYTASHIHLGFAGQAGGVEVGLDATLDDDEMSGVYEAANNTYTLTESQIDMLLNRELYLNIHSENFPPGEIRGQLLGEAHSYFYGNLDGLNEIINGSPVITNAAGGIVVEQTGRRLIISGSFDDLSSDLAVGIGGGAHLHAGGPDETGGVEIPLIVTTNDDLQNGIFNPADNTFEMDEDTETLLNEGRLYANIHSENYQPGEIRGQLLLDPHFFPTVSEIQTPEDGSTIILEGDPDSDLSFTWSEAIDPRDNKVVYIWQVGSDEEFDSLLVNLNVGNAAMANFTVGEVDSILAHAGVEEGDSITVYHRAISSNGSLNITGPSASVDLIRGTITSVDEDQRTIPDKLVLHQNYPNPFNPSTVITFELPEQEVVTLTIFDLLGREVATLIDNEAMEAGSYNVEFTAGNLSSGHYFYTLSTETSAITKQMLFIK